MILIYLYCRFIFSIPTGCVQLKPGLLFYSSKISLSEEINFGKSDSWSWGSTCYRQLCCNNSELDKWRWCDMKALSECVLIDWADHGSLILKWSPWNSKKGHLDQVINRRFMVCVGILGVCDIFDCLGNFFCFQMADKFRHALQWH